MLEAKIERDVCAYAKKLKILPVKFKDPARAGAPDRIFFGPLGVTFFIEFKAPGKKPRKNQLAYHKRLHQLGQDVYVVDNIDDGKRHVLRISNIIEDHLKSN